MRRPERSTGGADRASLLRRQVARAERRAQIWSAIWLAVSKSKTDPANARYQRSSLHTSRLTGQLIIIALNLIDPIGDEARQSERAQGGASRWISLTLTISLSLSDCADCAPRVTAELLGCLRCSWAILHGSIALGYFPYGAGPSATHVIRSLWIQNVCRPVDRLD